MPMTFELVTLAAAIVLALVFALRGGIGEHNAAERLWSRRSWISAAAGVSVAYAFVDVLPELAVQNRAIVEAAGNDDILFAEQRIYLLTLVSFVVMYGLQHMVLSTRGERQSTGARGSYDGIYWLHLAGYAAYSALIGYLLVERAERGAEALIVYTLAMAIHFLIVNHSLAEEHGSAYRRGGHWVLAVSVIAGWVAGTMVPLTDVAFARLFALLAGGVVITSLSSELPDDQDGRFLPFLIGAASFAVLLLFTA